jgi:homoserine O-acetyltransferase
MKALCFVLLAFLFHLAAFAQEGQQQFASLGEFRLESGETILECRLGYRTFGQLNSDTSNAVLFPTWFTGTTAQLVKLVGPGPVPGRAQVSGLPSETAVQSALSMSVWPVFPVLQ